MMINSLLLNNLADKKRIQITLSKKEIVSLRQNQNNSNHIGLSLWGTNCIAIEIKTRHNTELCIV